MKKIILISVLFGLITNTASATYYKTSTINCDDIAMLEDLDHAVAVHRAVITELNCEHRVARVAPKPQPKPVYKPKKVVKPIVKPVKPIVKPVVVEQPVIVKPVIVKPAPRPVIHRVIRYVPTVTVISVSENSYDCCDCDCGC